MLTQSATFPPQQQIKILVPFYCLQSTETIFLNPTLYFREWNTNSNLYYFFKQSQRICFYRFSKAIAFPVRSSGWYSYQVFYSWIVRNAKICFWIVLVSIFGESLCESLFLIFLMFNLYYEFETLFKYK